MRSFRARSSLIERANTIPTKEISGTADPSENFPRLKRRSLSPHQPRNQQHHHTNQNHGGDGKVERRFGPINDDVDWRQEALSRSDTRPSEGHQQDDQRLFHAIHTMIPMMLTLYPRRFTQHGVRCCDLAIQKQWERNRPFLLTLPHRSIRQGRPLLTRAKPRAPLLRESAHFRSVDSFVR